MKKLILLSALYLCTIAVSAQKYFTKTGTTEFKASVEAFEPVEAASESTTAILNTENGEVAALLFIKTFHFKVALMEEHFNENYMDSGKFPKASFKGNILGFDLNELGEQHKEYPIKGTLSIKGKDTIIETTGRFQLINDRVLVEAMFSVKPADFDIEIPGIVQNKIAENINITFNYELVKRN